MAKFTPKTHFPMARLISILPYTGNLCLCLALSPSQQLFSHVKTISCLPGLNRYKAEDKEACSRTQHCVSKESITMSKGNGIVLCTPENTENLIQFDVDNYCIHRFIGLFDLILNIPSTIFQL